MCVYKRQNNSEVKRLKANFRKAVGSGRRSGGGKIVIGLYNERCEIWGGSPAVESISFGIERSSTVTLNTANNDSMENSTLSEGIDYTPIPTTSSASQDEAELDVGLKQTEPKKWPTKRLSIADQLSHIARQEIALKKRAPERIADLDANHKEEMKMFQDSITTLANTIGNGFNMLHQLMQPQASINPQPFYSHGPQHFQRNGFVLENRNKNFQDIIEDPDDFNCAVSFNSKHILRKTLH